MDIRFTSTIEYSTFWECVINKILYFCNLSNRKWRDLMTRGNQKRGNSRDNTWDFMVIAPKSTTNPSNGGPILISFRILVISSTILSCIPDWQIILSNPAQFWPAFWIDARVQKSMTFVKSASLHTIAASFPPSSRITGVKNSDACFMTSLPTEYCRRSVWYNSNSIKSWIHVLEYMLYWYR